MSYFKYFWGSSTFFPTFVVLNSLFGLAGLFLGAVLTFFILKRKPQKSEPAEILTIQERKIFLMIQSGKSNKEISNELNIEISTVKSHVNNLYSKLKINSRKEILNI